MANEEYKAQLIEQIRMIQRAYQKEVDPYLKRLAEIQSLEPAPPICIDLKNIAPERIEEITRLICGDS